MQTQVYKNFLNPTLIEYLQHFLFYRIGHFIQTSNSIEEKNCFLRGEIHYDTLYDYLFYMIKKKLNKKLDLIRVYTNLQFPNMDGSYHVDPGDITCLLMIKGDGNFEIKNEESFPFEENTLIVFDAKKEHKGYAPKKGYRITLAFKTKEVKPINLTKNKI